jgi:predicted solute-binding protein
MSAARLTEGGGRAGGGRLRIAAAPYLNSRPLTDGLEVEHCAPSEGARRLAEGEVDVALVPIASVARAGDWVVIPGPCVAAWGPVESVLLVADCAVSELDTVMLDASSRTSAVLARLIVAKLRGSEDGVRCESWAPDAIPERIVGRRGAVVIGDHALDLAARR